MQFVNLSDFAEVFISEYVIDHPETIATFAVERNLSVFGRSTTIKMALASLLTRAIGEASHHDNTLITVGRVADVEIFFVMRSNSVACFNTAEAFIPYSNEAHDSSGVWADLKKHLQSSGVRIWRATKGEKGEILYFHFTTSNVMAREV